MKKTRQAIVEVPKLYNFLKKHRILIKYIKAIKADQRKYNNEAYTTIDSINRYSNRLEAFIGGAFSWIETPDGQIFWYKYYELAKKENNEDM